MQKKGLNRKILFSVFISLIILSVLVIAGPAGRQRTRYYIGYGYGYGYNYVPPPRITGGGGSSGFSACCDPIVNYAQWHCCNSPPSYQCCADPEAPVCRPYCTLLSCLGGTTYDAATGRCVIQSTTQTPPTTQPETPPQEPEEPAEEQGQQEEESQTNPETPPTPPPKQDLQPPEVKKEGLTDKQKQAIAAAAAAAAALGIIGGLTYAFWRKP